MGVVRKGLLLLPAIVSGFVAGPSALSRRTATSARAVSNAEEHEEWLALESALPQGFRVGTSSLEFTPVEAPIPAKMSLSLVQLDKPSPAFGAMFTRNAFPGSPVHVGRRRLDEPAIQAVLVNNKISNVCPGGDGTAPGVRDCEVVCQAVADELGLPSGAYVFPSSTGVIGWRLPVDQMVAAIPNAVQTLQSESALPAARSIMTTDRYPKVRSATLPGGGRIVGIAKGAGMIEPHLATMLSFVFTDIIVSREELRQILRRSVDVSFNCLSIDSDESTSDTVFAVSSGLVEADSAEFEAAFTEVCQSLARDVVRNGEGTNHVMEICISGAPNFKFAQELGRAVANSPLFKCAIAGNDPNVGRLLATVGKYLGELDSPVPVDKCKLTFGKHTVFEQGQFKLNPATESDLNEHMRAAEMSSPSDLSSLTFPPHEHTVKIGVDLGVGDAAATIYGSDLTAEYVAINADYRS